MIASRAIAGCDTVFDERGATEIQLFELCEGRADARAWFDVENSTHAFDNGKVCVTGFPSIPAAVVKQPAWQGSSLANGKSTSSARSSD